MPPDDDDDDGDDLCAGFLWYSVVAKYIATCAVFLLLRCSSSRVLSFEPLSQRSVSHWVI